VGPRLRREEESAEAGVRPEADPSGAGADGEVRSAEPGVGGEVEGDRGASEGRKEGAGSGEALEKAPEAKLNESHSPQSLPHLLEHSRRQAGLWQRLGTQRRRHPRPLLRVQHPVLALPAGTPATGPPLIVRGHRNWCTGGAGRSAPGEVVTAKMSAEGGGEVPVGEGVAEGEVEEGKRGKDGTEKATGRFRRRRKELREREVT